MSIVKQIKSGPEAREALMRGITTLSSAVKSTLGPRGRTVLIESENHIGGITVTKDGVTVAKSIVLMDPYENLAIRSIKDAASNTATQAGDGTTTSIVLVEALLNAAEKHMSSDNNVVEVTKNIDKIVHRIIEKLNDESIPVTDAMLYHVATVSSNNDEELGKLIADVYTEVGDSGVVTVEESKTNETYSETTKGIRFNRGIMSSFQITDPRRDLCVLDDPLILITDMEIKSLFDIEPVLVHTMKSRRPLLIIGNLEIDAQATLNKNIYEKKIKAANVLMPDFGFRSAEMLEDLAISVGATFFSEKMGNDWGLFNPETDLGSAGKVVIGRDSTSIIHSSQELNEATSSRIAEIRAQLKDEKRTPFIDAARARVSMLEGNAAIIHVGGDSDIEKKEKKDRVDDAVLATRAAIEGGILPGGGIALLDSIGFSIDNDDNNWITASNIVSEALAAPFKQILVNAGKDAEEFIADDRVGDGNGFNAKTEKFGDMIEMGIIDPSKVTTNALNNAASVANIIMTTDTVITNVRDMGGRS